MHDPLDASVAPDALSVSTAGRNPLVAPQSSDELDIGAGVVADLVLRRTLQQETTSTVQLAEELALPLAVVLQAFETLRARRQLDVHHLVGHDYTFSLTTEGRVRAEQRTAISAYCGPAPVSLDTYTEVVQRQRAATHVTRAMVKQAFRDLVIDEVMFDLIGPAFQTQRSIFLYGPTGTGKTSIAERLINLYTDAIVVPHAVEFDGQIITVFDPSMHQPLDDRPAWLDPRWVPCQRPIVVAGGELEASMLQLQRDRTSGVYRAPLQMKANNGMFLIDDFGRQLMPPSALLNRWIVPLDRRVDYLALDYGSTFAIPFELLVVFSTNIDPATLGDEAFFRRIQNKIYVGDVNEGQFDQILAMAAARYGLEVPAEARAQLRALCLRLSGTPLRPCYPWDICRLVRVIADYEDRPAVLSADHLVRAGELYFTKEIAATTGRVVPPGWGPPS